MVNNKALRWTAIALIVFAAAAGGVMIASGGWISPWAKRQITRALKERYGDLEIGSLDIRLLPRPRATGERLVFHRQGRGDAPPLMTLRRLQASAGWLDLLRSPRRIRHVRIEGLEIRAGGEKAPDEPDKPKGRSAAKPRAGFVIEEVQADGTVLEILPGKPGKDPLRFEIYKLTLQSVGQDRPMRYTAQLRNAKPPGLIDASGDFGPWNMEDSGRTPVTGEYRFSGADLGSFRGIAGTLSSTGRFRGPLERLEVNGETDTPDFTLTGIGRPVHLKTTFSAIVDGVNGDTLLQPVTARLGETTVTARGGVTGTPGIKGKTVDLQAAVSDGRLEDILRLAVKSEPPPMTGRISFHSAIVIPPGERDVIEKLMLDGVFDVASGSFANPEIQRKVSTLSERARGDTDGRGMTPAATDLRGKFVLKNGTITLTGLTFRVPGAAIRLNGTYGLRSEKIDFRGTAAMEAKVSQMTTGVKSFLLKALDPFFKKNNAGAVIPIRITGTRGKPSYGLNLGGK